MWTEEYVICSSCGAEVRLVTDGRKALAQSSWVANPRDGLGITTEVWRDGLSLVINCPIKICGDRECGAELRFNGECKGISVHDIMSAEPILMEAP